MDVFLHEDHAAEAKAAYDELVKEELDFVNDVHFTGSKDAELV